MYTSLGKANDRFGFRATGSFYCSYKNARLITIIGAALILLLVILILVNIIYYFSLFGNGGSIGDIIDIGRLFDLSKYASTEGEDHYLAEAFSSEFINMSVTTFATSFALFMLIIAGAVYLLVLLVLHKGRKYDFTANEERFVVTYPQNMHRTDAYKYEDVLGITWKSYKFPLLPECYDITVKTRTRSYEYRVILTKIARANGIVETPFNYIRERTGVSDKDEQYKMNGKI